MRSASSTRWILAIPECDGLSLEGSPARLEVELVTWPLVAHELTLSVNPAREQVEYELNKSVRRFASELQTCVADSRPRFFFFYSIPPIQVCAQQGALNMDVNRCAYPREPARLGKVHSQTRRMRTRGQLIPLHRITRRRVARALRKHDIVRASRRRKARRM